MDEPVHRRGAHCAAGLGRYPLRPGAPECGRRALRSRGHSAVPLSTGTVTSTDAEELVQRPPFLTEVAQSPILRIIANKRIYNGRTS